MQFSLKMGQIHDEPKVDFSSLPWCIRDLFSLIMIYRYMRYRLIFVLLFLYPINLLFSMLEFLVSFNIFIWFKIIFFYYWIVYSPRSRSAMQKSPSNTTRSLIYYCLFCIYSMLHLIISQRVSRLQKQLQEVINMYQLSISCSWQAYSIKQRVCTDRPGWNYMQSLSYIGLSLRKS